MGLRSHPWIIPVLLLLIVMLFGSSKLPDLARNMGRALKIVKKEVKDLREDDAAPEATSAPAATPPAAASAPAAPAAPAPAPPAPASPEATPAVAPPESAEGEPGDATPKA